MAILTNTVVNGSLRTNGIITTNELSVGSNLVVNGVTVSFLPTASTIANNSTANKYVTAKQVAEYTATYMTGTAAATIGTTYLTTTATSYAAITKSGWVSQSQYVKAGALGYSTNGSKIRVATAGWLAAGTELAISTTGAFTSTATAAATATATATATAAVTASNITWSTTSGAGMSSYYITFNGTGNGTANARGSASASASVTTSGWLVVGGATSTKDTGDKSSTATSTATVKAYLKDVVYNATYASTTSGTTYTVGNIINTAGWAVAGYLKSGSFVVNKPVADATPVIQSSNITFSTTSAAGKSTYYVVFRAKADATATATGTTGWITGGTTTSKIGDQNTEDLKIWLQDATTTITTQSATADATADATATKNTETATVSITGSTCSATATAKVTATATADATAIATVKITVGAGWHPGSTYTATASSTASSTATATATATSSANANVTTLVSYNTVYASTTSDTTYTFGNIISTAGWAATGYLKSAGISVTTGTLTMSTATVAFRATSSSGSGTQILSGVSTKYDATNFPYRLEVTATGKASVPAETYNISSGWTPANTTEIVAERTSSKGFRRSLYLAAATTTTVATPEAGVTINGTTVTGTASATATVTITSGWHPGGTFTSTASSTSTSTIATGALGYSTNLSKIRVATAGYLAAGTELAISTTGTLSVNGSYVSVNTAGWLAAGTSKNVGGCTWSTTYVSTTDTGYKVVTGAGWATTDRYVKAGAFTSTATAAASATATATATAAVSTANITWSTTSATGMSTYYIIFSATGNGTANARGSASASASVTTAGWLPVGGATSTKDTGAISSTATLTSSVTAYLKDAGITYEGGGLTGAADVGIAITSATGGVTATISDTAGTYYVKIQAGGTTKTVTRASYYDTRTAGWLPARTKTQILAQATQNITANTKTSYINLPAATVNTTTYLTADSTGDAITAIGWIGSKYKVKTATPAFDGGGLTGGGLTGGGLTGGGLTGGAVTGGGLTHTESGLTTSTTNSTGIYFTVSRAAVSRAAVSRAAVSRAAVSRAAVSRAAVLYNGAVNGWVTKADNAEALAANATALAANSTALAANATALAADSAALAASTTALAATDITLYVTGITVPANKTITIGGDGSANMNAATASSLTMSGNITASGTGRTISGFTVYGAVWNDFAEFRKVYDKINKKLMTDKSEIDSIVGKCVCENGDDTLSVSEKRLEGGAYIVSDTFGFSIGETDEAKCPIATAGRVLAYPYEGRKVFKKHIGEPVCAGPNGTVSLMTPKEIKKYPHKIIGTISAIPDYEVWGTGNVQINGRVWIKI